MAGGSRSSRRSARRTIGESWRALGSEQRLAAVAALLLIVSTFGPFSFVEGAIVLTGVSVLVLLRLRAEGREFHLPFGDGTMIAAAGAWAAVLILFRLFSRPLGQGLLALVCAALLVVAGLFEHTRRPADDVKQPASDDIDWDDSPTPSASRRWAWERRRARRASPSDLPFETRAPTWTPAASDPGGEGPFRDERRRAPNEKREPSAEQPGKLPPRRTVAPPGGDQSSKNA